MIVYIVSDLGNPTGISGYVACCPWYKSYAEKFFFLAELGWKLNYNFLGNWLPDLTRSVNVSSFLDRDSRGKSEMIGLYYSRFKA